MNLAQLIQSQNFTLLMQALDSAGALTAGRTVPARLLSIGPDGTATAAIGDAKVALVLAGPESKQAALQPGAILMLKLDTPERPGGDLRATLVEVRPPAPPQGITGPQTSLPAAQAVLPAQTSQPATQQPAPARPPADPAAPSPASGPASAAAPAASSAPPPGRSAGPGPLPAESPRLAATTAPNRPDAAPPSPSPRVLAGPLLGAALQRQDSLAPLFANLRGVAEGSLALSLPRPLLAAAERVLARSLPADGPKLTGPGLQTALRHSGLFHEATAAAGRPEATGGDLKAALLSLRETLEPVIAAFSTKPAPERPAQPLATPLRSETPQPPPPRRDGPLAPQPMAQRTLAPGDPPSVIAGTLLAQTDAALDRLTLSQYASLPLDLPRADPTQNAPQRWLAEIPLAFQTGTAMLPLQVEREPPRRGVTGATAPLWRVRFALDVEPLGPLQGVVTLQGRAVGVTLWAEREDTGAMLRGAAPGLEDALLQADFGAGSVDVHTGRPQVAQPVAGQFLDRLS